MKETTYLQSKPRYEILDGLRGVAALLVVAFHLFESYKSGDHTTQFINHGYLAVDFFFVLSGFVIGYAYDDRWSKMTLGGFFKRRLVRLHPLLILGTLIGGALFYLQGGSTYPLIFQTPWWKLLLLIGWGCLMLPALPIWDIRGWSLLNPLNGASWSLMYEYVANIMYALFIRHLPNKVLALLVVIFAFLTLDTAMNINVFGFKATAPYTLEGGFSFTPNQVYIGFVRLLYPFFIGLLISRIGKYIKIKNGFELCAFLLIVMFFMPHLGGQEYMFLDGIYNSLLVLIAFPLLVIVGAGSSIENLRSQKVCKFLGDISYPLYITHYPWIHLHIGWVREHKALPLSIHICVSVGLFIFAVAIAYASLKVYDEPVREWLKNRFLVNKTMEQK